MVNFSSIPKRRSSPQKKGAERQNGPRPQSAFLQSCAHELRLVCPAALHRCPWEHSMARTLHGTAIFAYIRAVWEVNVGIHDHIWSVWEVTSSEWHLGTKSSHDQGNVPAKMLDLTSTNILNLIGPRNIGLQSEIMGRKPEDIPPRTMHLIEERHLAPSETPTTSGQKCTQCPQISPSVCFG